MTGFELIIQETCSCKKILLFVSFYHIIELLRCFFSSFKQKCSKEFTFYWFLPQWFQQLVAKMNSINVIVLKQKTFRCRTRKSMWKFIARVVWSGKTQNPITTRFLTKTVRNLMQFWVLRLLWGVLRLPMTRE